MVDALIRGAASGIGRELAVACAKRGMKLVLADVDVDGLSATKDLMPSDIAVRTKHCDVSSFEAVRSLADLAFGKFGSVHLLFNNAGVAAPGPGPGAYVDVDGETQRSLATSPVH